MIRYLLTKIKNKYKLYACLICGMVAMTMIFSMIQMFRLGSLNKVIQRGFIKQNSITGVYPASVSGVLDITSFTLQEELAAGKSVADTINEQAESYAANWKKSLQLPVVADQRFLYFLNVRPEYGYVSNNMVINLGCLDDGLDPAAVKDHYTLEAGVDYYEDISEYAGRGAEIPEDAYPCLISRYTADSCDLVIGEVLSFPFLVYTNGNTINDQKVLQVYISGIISEKPDDYYWQKSLSKGAPMLILTKEDFLKISTEYTKECKCEVYQSLDYRDITSERVGRVKSILAKLKKKDDKLEENITPVLESYRVESRSVQQMVYVIVLPLMVLIITFIGLISFRIIESETRELQTLRDRGLSKLRLIQTYFLSAFFLSQISVPIGIVLGFFFGRAVAGVADFMGFTAPGTISVSEYVFNPSMVVAAEIAAFLAILINLVPVLLFFRKKKDQRRISIVPFWERYFLDVVLLAVSVYLLFNYNKQLTVLSDSVMKGDGIDPVIFINATLFLFACGLLMLRLIFYLITIVYKIGRKHFSPATFAGLLQIIRTRKSSGVISVFMVVTVAMSLFHANMARTINSNIEARLQYEAGTDLRITEKWPITMVKSFDDEGNTVMKWRYTEPDFGIYRSLVEDGTCTRVTKVANNDSLVVTMGKAAIRNVQIMGIQTREFGETAILKNGLNKQHFYTYLNDLGAEYEGALISSNLARELKAKEGDSINCDMLPPKVTGMKNPFATAKVKIVGIVDSWPGYQRYHYTQGEEGEIIEEEKYLVVMNYPFVNANYGMFPYQVWGDLPDKGKFEYKEFRDRLKGMLLATEREAESVLSWENEVAMNKESAIIQITNGLFTADFLIALLLCVIGYMIYWITSIRDRELLFGICRAMGITEGEVNRMLVMEQLFLSFMSILAGVGAGLITSKFFASVFAAVYLPQKHNVPVFVSSPGVDTIRLSAVLIVVVIICILWIRRILKGLNITRALKLGED
ncbi:MAG: FtsX-like permease family protein [Lachnospiraceae bacterium]|nr:FtsX-like permease family protein [Lachnospiraceae bacterium]